MLGSDSESAGSVGMYVSGGPVGPYGTQSPFYSDLSGPVGLNVAGGPVGPYGTLSPFNSDHAGLVGPYVAGDPLDRMGRCPPPTLTLLAMLACVGCYPSLLLLMKVLWALPILP